MTNSWDGTYRTYEGRPARCGVPEPEHALALALGNGRLSAVVTTAAGWAVTEVVE